MFWEEGGWKNLQSFFSMYPRVAGWSFFMFRRGCGRGCGCDLRDNRSLSDMKMAEETFGFQQSGLFLSSEVSTWTWHGSSAGKESPSPESSRLSVCGCELHI